MGAGQGLQPAVPLADGLPAQAAVELGLLHALVEAHDVGAQLPLQPLAAVDALAQTVQLQLAQLGPRGRECRRRAETRSVPVSSRPPPLAQPKAAQGPVLGTFLPGGWTWGKKCPALSGPWFPLVQNEGVVRSGVFTPRTRGDPMFLKGCIDRTCCTGSTIVFLFFLNTHSNLLGFLIRPRRSFWDCYQCSEKCTSFRRF